MKSFRYLTQYVFVAQIILALAITKAHVIAGDAEKATDRLRKPAAIEHRRSGIHDGNQILVTFSNYGYIGSRVLDVPGEWPRGSGIDYFFESTFYVGAEVTDSFGLPRHIITDSYSGGPRDKAPDDSHTYSWEPLSGYFNEDRSNVNNFPAMSHLPETWPASWLNAPDEWSGKWNGEFGPFPIADQESYYVMDDRNNDEFGYYPFIGSRKDSLPFPTGRRGLGIEVAVRGYQWADPRLEDVWFAVYDLTNVSDKDLEKLVCGFYHDWDIGTTGPGGEREELFAFDVENRLVYQWDLDGLTARGQPAGYISQKILQTPDNLGLTSFYGTSAGDVLSDDEQSWDVKIKPGVFIEPDEGLNIAYIGGSGYFSLQMGETKRYAAALVFGDNVEDIYQNARLAQWFYDGGYNFDIHSTELIAPPGGKIASGGLKIRWQASGDGEPLLVDIFYSIDNWKTWHTIATDQENDGSYLWDTNLVADGIHYSVQVIAHNNLGMGQSSATDYFTINNPRAAYPDVIVTAPNAGDIIDGLYNITWHGGDADGDPVSLTFFYSPDSGHNWQSFATNEANDETLLWDTTQLPNGVNYRLKAVISDGALEGSCITEGSFVIDNYHPAIREATVEHLSGNGSGTVNINVIDREALTGHRYELTFSGVDTSKTYNVYDVDTEMFSLQQVEFTSFAEGPQFDGVRIWIQDFAETTPIDSLTDWTKGEANLEIDIGRSMGYRPTEIPADFEIRILGSNADTSYSVIDRYSIPVNFQVWNVTDSTQMEFLFDEGDVSDGKISPNDELTIITNRVGHRFNVVWEITFSEPDLNEAILPDSGDVAFIAIAKPFSEQDTFRFRTLTEYIAVDEFSDNLQPQEFRLSQNYPNPFNAGTSIEYELAAATKVEVKIYDILGREIMTLVDGQQNEGVHRIRWDGFDKQNKKVASGVYLYRIEAGGFVDTKKMIFLK